MNKPTITELKAAAQSQERIIRMSLAEWQAIYERFRGALGNRFQVEDERMASFDLALAATALDLQAVKNLFPPEQAGRIQHWVENLVNSKEWGEYAVSEVRAYGQIFQKEVEAVGSGSDPMSAIPTRLLHRWLGEGIRRFEVKVESGSQNIGIVDPLLVGMGVEALMPFVGIWKSIKDQYELIEEDLPIDTNWQAYGLYDLGEHPDDRKPDGTIIFRDNDGKTRESWFHPRKLAKLLSRHDAKRIGTFHRVMVRGPWEGIKETTMQLSDESVKAFVDGNDRAYAVCAFKQGKPEYSVVKKKAWDNWDQAQAIISDATLTDLQRTAALKHILEGK